MDENRKWTRRAVVGIALAVTASTGVAAGATAADTAPGGRVSSSSDAGGGGWVPAPSGPFDRDAGVLCDFAIHGEPIVDEVRKRTLRTNPLTELYVGRLVIRVTNKATGKYIDSDASGDAVITTNADGSQFWSVVGPTQIGFRAGTGNLPRGLYRLDGVYTLKFDPTLVNKTYTPIYHATRDNLCDHLS